MTKRNLFYCLAAVCLLGQSVFSQTSKDETTLGLPGDNLDLYAVLDLFQKSKTIEDFEKSLNEKKSEVNNLDLDLDKKVDFIKVVSKKVDPSFTFILQVAVSKTETQDVAVILVDKDKNGKVSLQIVGDEDLYGKNYVIEPKSTAAVTANPAYTGSDPVAKSVPASSAVVVEQTPIIEYIYSPVYVPYVPPYYYGYYPPYYVPFAVISLTIYHHHHYHIHHGYHGGHYGGRNTVIIHNKNVYNNYNINRSRSNTVITNRDSGKYNTRKNSNNKPAARASERKTNKTPKDAASTTRKTNDASNRPARNTSQLKTKASSVKTTAQGVTKRPVRTRS
ncbi:hypothetical protein [uncultured Flavobacterium sp.]|uniref:hypothetical protein n=1 Tax=uncultured Flavobacterium sp. TaxID=165435 RepID=UPI002930536A|nr:hypothetical protein [uncultured Flavobacterium sp.]